MPIRVPYERPRMPPRTPIGSAGPGGARRELCARPRGPRAEGGGGPPAPGGDGGRPGPEPVEIRDDELGLPDEASALRAATTAGPVPRILRLLRGERAALLAGGEGMAG